MLGTSPDRTQRDAFSPLLTHASQQIIMAIKAFRGNPHDSKTIAPLFKQLARTGQLLPDEVIYDRGGRGKKVINGVYITTPTKPKKTDSGNKQRRPRRAGIEAITTWPKTICMGKIPRK